MVVRSTLDNSQLWLAEPIIMEIEMPPYICHCYLLQGVSITITSLTDFLAFMIGASSVSFTK